MTLTRLAFIGALLAAYAVLSHALMVHAPDRPWAVAALFGPLWAAVAWAGLRRRHGPTLAACALVVVLLVVVVSRGGVRDIHLMYVLQHAVVHLALAWTFGSTLRDGGTPLITALGERVHDTFTPTMRAYTRRLTAAWTLYFLGMIAGSLLVYLLADWSWWSLYCNAFTPLSVVAFFAVEYRWRLARHPEFERVSMVRVFDAYRRHGQPSGLP